jgi:hypothetical protein
VAYRTALAFVAAVALHIVVAAAVPAELQSADPSYLRPRKVGAVAPHNLPPKWILPLARLRRSSCRKLAVAGARVAGAFAEVVACDVPCLVRTHTEVPDTADSCASFLARESKQQI